MHSTNIKKLCKEDYRKFLSRHDMVFEKPAGQWEQGVPMGNGVIGTVVWGGGDRPMKISLDRADIWELRNIHPDYEDEFNWRTFTHYLETENKEKLNTFLNPGRENPNPTRFPVGRLEFTTQGQVANHTMRFRLSDAVTEGRTETDLGAVRWETWVSATDQVLVLETWTEGGETFSMRPKFLSRPGDYTDEDTKESTRWKAFGGLAHPERKPHTMTQYLKAWGYPDSLEGTEGAFLVSAVRKEYITQFVEIKAEHGGKLILRTDFGAENVHAEINGTITDLCMQDGTLELNAQIGDTIFLWAGENRPEAKIQPLKGIPTDYNFYGVKKISRF